MLSPFTLYRVLISHIWRINGLIFIGEKTNDNFFSELRSLLWYLSFQFMCELG